MSTFAPQARIVYFYLRKAGSHISLWLFPADSPTRYPKSRGSEKLNPFLFENSFNMNRARYQTIVMMSSSEGRTVCVTFSVLVSAPICMFFYVEHEVNV